MANSIAYTRSYTSVLGEVYKRAACLACLNCPRRIARAERNVKEIMVPKIEVTDLGDYTRNVGYKTGSITYEFETKTFNYGCSIKLLADVMPVEEVFSDAVGEDVLTSLPTTMNSTEAMEGLC